MAKCQWHANTQCNQCLVTHAVNNLGGAEHARIKYDGRCGGDIAVEDQPEAFSLLSLRYPEG